MTANLFTIPPGQPFLPTLAHALVDGRLVPGFAVQDDPLALAGVTIFVPTRRAARSLASAFAAVLGRESALLPAIRPLGESDDAALFNADDAARGLQPAMDGLTRRLTLARLVRGWRSMTAKADLQALIGETIVPPASASDALWLAADLGRLLDEAETEGVGFDTLAGLAPDRLAEWWQLTRTFLSIVTDHWPQALTDAGLVSEAGARNAWLFDEAERWRSGAAPGPVVIAGSTATAPATIELMHAVAGRADGALVLPGLDTGLDAADRETLVSAASIVAPGHPQYGLNRILSRFARPPESVARLDAGLAPALASREALVADALRPAASTDRWAASREAGSADAALAGLSIVEARDAREEALVCAVAMRDALEDPDATTALITPDRDLARRVVVELERFGIEANDSGGRPLAATAPGTLLSTALRVALEPGDPIALIALLKHPLTRLGLESGQARQAARALETIALRGSVDVPDGAHLAKLFAGRRAALEAGRERFARPVRLVPAAERDLGAAMAERLEAALRPLTALRHGDEAEIAAFAIATTNALEALAADEKGDASPLYAAEPGRALADFLSSLVGAPATGFAFAPRELPDVMEALVADVSVRPRAGLSARAFVLGALEARLQHVDVAVLGGLNEGTWPGGARNGAFLSRLMRREMALDPPERRIGLAAHDFWMATGMPRVVMTRSLRAEGAPTIASRWLQRLTTRVGPQATAALHAGGAVYLAAARALDVPERRLPPALRPVPRPPVDKRPTRYSVTEIERLIRDPYAIHAARVMELEPLPELIRDPHAAERGSLYHDVLGTFVQRGHSPVADDAHETLTAIARESFAQAALPADVEAIWWPRMVTLIDEYLAWEAGRDATVAERHAEIPGSHELIDLATTLSGRADRIDLMTDGRIEIIDFKTGSTPSVAQARTLLSPQLALEGAMAQRGAFGEALGDRPIADALFVRLRERTLVVEGLSTEGGRGTAPVDAEGLSARAYDKLKGLVAFYRDETKGFVSRARPVVAGDYSGAYDHLARAQEWAAGEEDGQA